MNAKDILKQEAIKALKQVIDPRKGIIIVQKTVSRSGMQRGLEIYNHDGTRWLTANVAEALDWGRTKDGHLKVTGCGMDMHFATADALTWALYGRKHPKGLSGNGGSCIKWNSL